MVFTFWNNWQHKQSYEMVFIEFAIHRDDEVTHFIFALFGLGMVVTI